VRKKDYLNRNNRDYNSSNNNKEGEAIIADLGEEDERKKKTYI